MIVTPAQAGVQFKDAWIPACAGMTDSTPQYLLIFLGHNTKSHLNVLLASICLIR